MARPLAVTALAILSCVATGSCGVLLGDVEVGSAPQEPASRSGSAGVTAPVQPLAPGPAVSGTGSSEVVGGTPVLVPPRDAGAGLPSLDPPAPEPDAGPPAREPDAAPPAPVPRSVVAGPASELERVGIDGGEPHLGVCAGGVVIGVVPTANPSMELFGQRLTFIEPVCGQVLLEPAARSLTVVQDDSLLSWDATPPFVGAPSREVPDPRLTWVLQPATLCPAATPVLVGLSGQYDPVAPDYAASDALRSLVIECAPLAVAPNGVDVTATAAGHQRISQADSFAIPGSELYESRCLGGRVVTQIHLDAGFWLDGFTLGCSLLSSP